MKKLLLLLLFISVGIALQASQLQEVREQSLLRRLPVELIQELTGFAGQQILPELKKAKTQEEALQKVKELAKNPFNAKYFEDPKTFEAILFIVNLLNEIKYRQTTALAAANALNLPGKEHWIKDIYPLEKELDDSVRKADFKEIEKLIGKGVNIDARVGRCFQTPLMTAVGLAADLNESQYLPVVSYLLKKGAEVNAQDCKGFTALVLGAKKTNIVRLLLDHKANPFIESFIGNDIWDMPEFSELFYGVARKAAELFRAAKSGNLQEVKDLD